MREDCHYGIIPTPQAATHRITSTSLVIILVVMMMCCLLSIGFEIFCNFVRFRNLKGKKNKCRRFHDPIIVRAKRKGIVSLWICIARSISTKVYEREQASLTPIGRRKEYLPSSPIRTPPRQPPKQVQCIMIAPIFLNLFTIFERPIFVGSSNSIVITLKHLSFSTALN